MKEINNVVKELVCGITTCDKESYPLYYPHPDYNKRQDAFVVINDKCELFEVKVSKLEIKLTREEKRNLKEYLYDFLLDLSEHHYDLYPNKRDSLDCLIGRYFYWGDKYNDGYISELDSDAYNRLDMYLCQEFKKFMAIPVSIRY